MSKSKRCCNQWVTGVARLSSGQLKSWRDRNIEFSPVGLAFSYLPGLRSSTTRSQQQNRVLWAWQLGSICRVSFLKIVGWSLYQLQILLPEQSFAKKQVSSETGDILVKRFITRQEGSGSCSSIWCMLPRQNSSIPSSYPTWSYQKFQINALGCEPFQLSSYHLCCLSFAFVLQFSRLIQSSYVLQAVCRFAWSAQICADSAQSQTRPFPRPAQAAGCSTNHTHCGYRSIKHVEGEEEGRKLV